ncbi:MAG: C25 family cysteine peptidase [Chitinispirillales bacterium]|nr:C25 family cysteine peptidase [Chitinispirillales bacterium]
MVESTPSRLVLDWELTGFDTVVTPVVSEFGRVDRQIAVYYDGGGIPTGDSGGVLIHAYPIHAGVPARGEVRVSVESPELSVVRLGGRLQRRASSPDSSEPRFASRWVSEPRYGMLRGYRAAHLLLRPVYDMGRGRVQLLKRARIVVEFPASAHTGSEWRPRGEYERMTSRMLLNFKVAQGWHVSPGRGGLRKAAEMNDPYPFAFGTQLARFKVGDGNRNLNEGLTNENSLIKIRGSKIREIFGNRVRMASVALYASHGGEMDVFVPATPDDVPAGVYEVPILRYDLNGNGDVDDDDYVVAYVSGASDWVYDDNMRRFGFSLNRYDDSRTYWLAVKGGEAGMAMGRFEQPAAGAAERGVYEANLYLRAPLQLSVGGENHEGGIEWMWKRFTLSRIDTTIRLDLPGIDERIPGSITILAGTSYGGSLSADLGGVRQCSVCGGSEHVVNDWRSKDLLIKYGSGGSTMSSRSYYELSAVHVRYSRPLALGGDAGKLEIFSSNDAEPVRYRLSKSENGLAYIVRVPADGRGIELVDTVRSQSYAWGDVGGEGIRYMAMLEREIVDYSDSLSAWGGRQEQQAAQYQIRDLRNVGNTADFLIITHEEFLSAALRLAAHKAGIGFGNPVVVLLGDILNQFGGGNMDPVAIRNFLYYVYWNWIGGQESLSYVTFFGAGHYDYKNVSSRAVNFMPIPYISGRLNEDFYVFFDQYHPNMQHDCSYFIGRLPARSLSEANDIVEKIKEMEDPRVANFDSWRGRVLLTADDDQQGSSPDYTNPPHVASSELASRIISGGRPDIGMRKIYLFEYGWDERYYKPAATRALINEINSGVAVVNWFGHGSISQIADEMLFSREYVSALDNRRRYPLFSMFSCSVGKYDQPGEESLAAALLKQPLGGGIASIASAREVYANNNENLALPFFSELFSPEDDAELSLGGALVKAKIQYTTYDNRYYVLLGDPSIKIIGRGRGVEDFKITDTSGVSVDTLKALQRVTIRGKVNGVRESDSVYAAITLFNPQQDSVRRKDGGNSDTVTAYRPYSLPGSPVFSATKVRVGRDGRFEQPVLLPMNLAFGKPGVKLTAYAWKEKEGSVSAASYMGAGYRDGLVFYGSESANLSDNEGPKISVRPLYYKDGTLEPNQAMNSSGLFVKNRITAQLPLTLEVKIEDESGINKIGGGPDEGITMEVKGALSKRSINHLFDFDTGSFTQGKAVLAFEENMLGSGTYDLIISAQDLLGNVSKLNVVWDVTDGNEIRLDHVINVPNPVKMGQETRFYYTHSNVSGDLSADITIRVYSLGGRLLSVIRNRDLINGYKWVPRDNRGNLLTPNVYLYQITATSSNVGKTVKSKIKKLAVLPPR